MADDKRRHDAHEWDERYAAHSHVWSHGPNAEVERILEGWAPSTALDLGAGEGRHALWLAGLGWQVTAVDFSAVGIERGRASAAASDLSVEWVVGDATTWEPPAGTAYGLVLVSYLHLPQDVLSRAAQWVAPGGALLVVAHSLRNLTEGVGGPSDPTILHTLDGLRSAAKDLQIERCEELLRPTDEGDAIDVVLIARRPAAD